jgi:Leucine-rich repeat (LRR) protein
MNQNTILLSYLSTKNKLSKLFGFNNYYAKLLYIQDFSNCYSLIKSKNFFKEYKLFLDYNKIIEKINIKFTIIELIKLSVIRINCKSNYIPSQIALLQNLEIFDYYNYYDNDNKYYGKLNYFPIHITKLINLKILDLSHNSIPFISTQIGNLINLKKLNLNNFNSNTN